MKSYPQAWVNIGQIHNLKFLFRTRYDSHCLYLDLHPHPPLPLQETVSVSVNKMALCYTFWVQLSFFSFLARWINGWEENQSSQPGIFPFGGFHFLEILDNSQLCVLMSCHQECIWGGKNTFPCWTIGWIRKHPAITALSDTKKTHTEYL